MELECQMVFETNHSHGPSKTTMVSKQYKRVQIKEIAKRKRDRQIEVD